MLLVAHAIAHNAFIASAARILGSVFAFFSIAFIGRALGPHGFGDYSAGLAFFFFFHAFADLGLYLILVREISRPGAREKEIIANIFTMRLFALAVFLGLGMALIWVLPYGAELKKASPLVALVYFFLSSTQILMGLFQKHLRVWEASLAELVGRVAIFLLNGALYFSEQKSLVLFFGAAACAAGIQFFFTAWFARRFVPLGFAFEIQEWKRYIRIALPVAASSIFILIYFKLDTILLSLIAPNPSRDTGIYALAYKFLESILFFPAMFVGLIMPLLSEAAKDNLDRFKRIFQKAVDVLWIVYVPVLFGGLSLGLTLMILLGGEEFREAATPFRVLLLAVGFIFFGALLGQAVVALDLQRKAITVYFVGMAFNVGANLVAIPFFSYNGAAWITVATEALIDVGLALILYRSLRIMPLPSRFMPPVVAALIMSALLWIAAEFLFARIGFWLLFPAVGGGALVYAGLLYAFGGITKEDLGLFMPNKQTS